MAIFSSKYKLPFFTQQGRRFNVLLQKRNYTGPSYSIKGGGAPAVIRHPLKKRKYSPIAGSEFKMELLHEENGTEYNLRSEFQDITDREWQAVLQEEREGTSWRADGAIDLLNITTSNIPSVGSFSLDSLATNYSPDYTAELEFTVNQPVTPTLSTVTMFLNAVHKDNVGGGSTPARVLYLNSEIPKTWTTEQVVNDIVASSPDITKVSASKIKYTTDDNAVFFPDDLITYYISSEWVLNLYVLDFNLFEPATTITQNSTYFSIPNIPTIDILWRYKNLTGSESLPVPLASYTGVAGETVASVLNNLRTQITEGADYIDIPNVTVPDAIPTDPHTMRVYVTVEGTSLVFKVLENTTRVNGIPFREDTVNQSYFNVVVNRDTPTDYAITPVTFAGGAEGGDTFVFTSTLGNASITASQGEEVPDIIQKLVNAITLSIPDVECIVNPENTAAFLVLYEGDGAAATYSFTTSGGSTVSDNGPAWAVSSQLVIRWTGFVAPGFNSLTHKAGSSFVIISALDGLGDLKNSSFSTAVSAVFAKLSFMNIIALCLQKTGLSLQIYETFNLFETNMDPARRPIVQAQIQTLLLNGESCYYVLELILSIMEAYVIQVNGRWELHPTIHPIDGNITYHNYTSTGAAIGTTQVLPRLASIGSCTNNVMIGGGANIRRRPPFKELITEQDYGFVSQLIQLPTFNDFNVNILDVYNYTYPWQWADRDGNTTINNVNALNRDSDGLLRISPIANVELQEAYRLRQVIPIGELPLKADGDSRDYLFTMVYEEPEDPNASDTLNIVVRMDAPNEETTFLDFDEEDDTVNPVVTNPLFAKIEISKTGLKKSKVSVAFDFPYADTKDATCAVELLSTFKGFVRIESVKIEANASVASKQRISEYYVDKDDEGRLWRDTYVSQAETLAVNLADSADATIAAQIYKKAIYINTGDSNTLSTRWTMDPVATTPQYLPLLNWVRTHILEEYAVPYNALTASIKGTANYYNLLQDVTDNNKLYVYLGGSWDVRNDTLQGDWEQTNLKNDSPIYPASRVVDILQTDKSSSSTNGWTGAGGGGNSTDPTPVEFPVTSVNTLQGNVTLKSDNIPDAGQINRFVTLQGKTLAEQGGKIYTGIIQDEVTEFPLIFNNEKVQIRYIVEGTTELSISLALASDSATYSRQITYVLDNRLNSVKVETLNFIDDEVAWVWEQNTQPLNGIPSGEFLILRVTNIGTLFVIAIATTAVGGVADVGIGQMVIGESFIVR